MNSGTISSLYILLGILFAALAVGGSLAISETNLPNVMNFNPPPVIPLKEQPPANIVVDAPLPEQLKMGYVVIRYKAENLRILPVFGRDALKILPRIGHLHITIDDLPWHWLDASGEPISIRGLPPGPHKVLLELEDPIHKVIDSKIVDFEIPPLSSPK